MLELNIASLREKNKFTKDELAKKLGVTSKRISLWEKGERMPPIEVIEKLSSMFHVKVQDLLNKQKRKDNVHKIVITGGPCAGKSTALSLLKETFAKKGYKVLFINESATELITSGINRSACKNDVEFQVPLFKMQQDKERLYYELAQNSENKILIICDRGLLDSKAFLSNEKFETLLERVDSNEIEARDNYDAVFHLVTAAKGAEKFYTLENNAARSESVEEAKLVDDKLILAWTGHPYLKIIDNSTDFKGKMDRLINEIDSYLKQSEFIEKKYLIKWPIENGYIKNDFCKEVQIIETYLSIENNKKISIEQRGIAGKYLYFKKENEMRRKNIAKEEYLNLLMKADSSCHQIRKNRYYLVYGQTYFKIDVYPFIKNKAIIKFEYKDENEKIYIPDFIEIIKDISLDENYDDYLLSKR